MACQTSWSKKACNSLIKSRSTLRKEPRISQDTSRLNRHNLDLSNFSHSHSPISKSKILTRLSDAQKDNGPTLFNLIGQCFQDIGLTEWASIITKQCPTEAIVGRQTLTSPSRIILRQSPDFQMLVTSWSTCFAPLWSLPSCQCMTSCIVEYSS